MKYNISIDDINNLNFNENFKNIINNPDDEFYSVPGKEHYKLLSYFSTLFNNSNIIDIGTHRGCSALALSYNKSNTIYSFDIINNLNNINIQNTNNINFCYDNLFNKDIFIKWKSIILSCPFIFLDVDPHNGLMEYEFINYIKELDILDLLFVMIFIILKK